MLCQLQIYINTLFCFRSAIEILEAEIIETKCDISAIDNGISDQPIAAACEIPKMRESNVVSARCGRKFCSYTVTMCSYILFAATW